MSLAEKLDKIKSPKLQNQHHTAVVLSAVEDTLRDQKTDFSPTAYFAALLALLTQSITSNGIVNKDLATSVVYLLDVVTPFVPEPLLRSKFSQILVNLAPALTQADADAPLLRASIGCLESLLVAQDAAAWALPQTQVGPRRAMAGLLKLAMDHRPKVRKRAQDAVRCVLEAVPRASPRLDHPAADLCAETALQSLNELASVAGKNKRSDKRTSKAFGPDTHDPGLIHAMQLIKTISSASEGWPSRKIEPLCELLMKISKSSNEYLTMAAFEVFESILVGMANEISSQKLPRLLEVVEDLRPSQNDSQLLPPWVAVLSRGYDVCAQVSPDEVYTKLPELFSLMSGFLASPSSNVCISASECLVSFMANCVPQSIVLAASMSPEQEDVLRRLAQMALELLSVKYQAAQVQVFAVVSSMFDAFKWKSDPFLVDAVRIVGELRGNSGFENKKEADEVIGSAIEAVGPEAVMRILPLNLLQPKPERGQPGRAWLLPILRDHVRNTNLAHFRSVFVPLSETLFQRVLDHGDAEKTVAIKTWETLVQQIWALLPGYCTLPLDLVTAFDQSFAELVSNLLYSQTELRVDLCRGLQNLVDSNKAILAVEVATETESATKTKTEDLLRQGRVTKDEARKNVEHLASISGNMLKVLVNVYSQTLPQYRGYILQCINAYLSIAPPQELTDTFNQAAALLQTSIEEAGSQAQADKQKQNQNQKGDRMPPASHTLMDFIITMAVYLPRECFAPLFTMAAHIINRDEDAQLQKKAYKLIPRLAESDIGKSALADRNEQLQQLLLSSASKASVPSRRDRLDAISTIIAFLPDNSLHFILSILPEVVNSCKEVNEKARSSAFDLLVQMGQRMRQGGTVSQSKVPSMAADAPDVTASLEEYMTMVSAGLAGSHPHMVSATITALTRILYEFRSDLPDSLLADIVETMDIFLKSPNREIVRSVLGFVKVCVISLPTTLVLPRLKTLIPNLFVWSHEHTAHFRQKVKHIFERMIRRFGYDEVERYCPEDDKKLLINIKKTHERQKRRKEDTATEPGDESVPAKLQRRRFDNEYDAALYSDESSSSGSDVSDNEVLGRNRRSKAKPEASKSARGQSEMYIVEDDDEPLDLLSSRAMAHISTTKPIRGPPLQPGARKKAKTDADGKLILGGEDSDDQDMMDVEPGDDVTLEGGINAYVEAIRGKNAVTKGAKGRLKVKSGFGKRRNDDMDMDEDDKDEDVQEQSKRRRGQAGSRGGRAGRGGIAARSQRRPLGATKLKGGRVSKPGNRRR